MRMSSKISIIFSISTFSFCTPKTVQNSSLTAGDANAGFGYDILITNDDISGNGTYCLRPDTANLCHFFKVIPSGTQGKQGEVDSLKCTMSVSKDHLNVIVNFERPLKAGMIGTKTLSIKGTAGLGKFPSGIRQGSVQWIFHKMEQGTCLPQVAGADFTPPTGGGETTTPVVSDSATEMASTNVDPAPVTTNIEQTTTPEAPGTKQLLVTLSPGTKMKSSLESSASSCDVKTNSPILVYVSYNSSTNQAMINQRKQLFSFKEADRNGCAFSTGFVDVGAVSCLQIGSGFASTTLSDFRRSSYFSKPCP